MNQHLHNPPEYDVDVLGPNKCCGSDTIQRLDGDIIFLVSKRYFFYCFSLNFFFFLISNQTDDITLSVSGFKFNQNSGSGSKFNVFGSTTMGSNLLRRIELQISTLPSSILEIRPLSFVQGEGECTQYTCTLYNSEQPGLCNLVGISL